MTERKNRIKGWIEEHKEEIKGEVIRICWYAVGIGVGYFIGGKIHDLRIDSGTKQLYIDGILKFFDPSTGQEINLSELGKVVKRIYK